MNRVVAAEALLPACTALVVTRASCVPEVLEGYERLIEEGCGMPLAAALGHERAASRELVRTVTAIAGRRQELLARARAQSKTPAAG